MSEYAEDAHLLKLQHPQNTILRAIRSVDRRSPVHELYVAFNIPYMYDYITKLSRTQAEVILNHVNPNARGTGQGKATHRRYKRLKIGGGQAYDRSAD
jgi:hypothetical protein